jgi:hypothetical protein
MNPGIIAHSPPVPPPVPSVLPASAAIDGGRQAQRPAPGHIPAGSRHGPGKQPRWGK